jgi:peptidoglycan hydrolase CwlO-like protein
MKFTRLPPLVHTVVVLSSIVLSYLFVSNNFLSQYSLQAVAIATMAFFAVKVVNQQKIHHFIPQYASFEVALITFIFTLLIGATGNTESIFYPLIYIYLFLLVFSTYTQTAIITTLGLMLYQYILMPGWVSYVDTFDLVSIPIVLVFFIFAKQQHEALIQENQQLEAEDNTLAKLETQVDVLTDQLSLTQQELNRSQTELTQLKQECDENYTNIPCSSNTKYA